MPVKKMEVEIRDCMECPFCEGDSLGRWICTSKKRDILEITVIPDWCPLEDW